MHGEVVGDAPRAADVVGSGGGGVVGALAVDHADRMDRRQVQHVEAHRSDVVEPVDRVAQRCVSGRRGDRGAREELVPGAEPGPFGIDLQRQRTAGGERLANGLTPEHVAPIVVEHGRATVGEFGQPCLEAADVGRAVRLVGACSFEQVADDRLAGHQLDGDIDIGVDLAFGAVSPCLRVIRPADHLELVGAELGRHERGVPTVVAVELHGELGPLPAAALGRHGAPSQGSIDGVVSVAEHVGHHGHRFAERSLGGEPAAVDQR